MNEPNLENACCEWQEEIAEKVRRNPIEAVSLAVIAGVLLPVLPVRQLVLALVKLGLVLLKPAVILLVVWKGAEALMECCQGEESTRTLVDDTGSAPGPGDPA